MQKPLNGLTFRIVAGILGTVVLAGGTLYVRSDIAQAEDITQRLGTVETQAAVIDGAVQFNQLTLDEFKRDQKKWNDKTTETLDEIVRRLPR